jgi:hypothetical protein
MLFESFSFGSIRIDSVTYDHDLVIDRGEVRKRKRDRLGASMMPTVTRPSQSKKTYPGIVAAWWSAPGQAPCR